MVYPGLSSDIDLASSYQPSFRMGPAGPSRFASVSLDWAKNQTGCRHNAWQRPHREQRGKPMPRGLPFKQLARALSQPGLVKMVPGQ